VIPEVNCHWKPQRLRKLVPKLTRKVFSSKFQARYLILYSCNRLPGLKRRCWTRGWAIIQSLYDRCAFIGLCDNNASIWCATRCTEATVISLPWPEGENEWNERPEPLLSEQLNLNLCRYVVLKYKKCLINCGEIRLRPAGKCTCYTSDTDKLLLRSQCYVLRKYRPGQIWVEVFGRWTIITSIHLLPSCRMLFSGKFA